MQRLWFLRSARCLMLIDIYMKSLEDSLNAFQVIEQTRVWQSVIETGRQMPQGKTICLPTLKGGEINRGKIFQHKNALSLMCIHLQGTYIIWW